MTIRLRTPEDLLATIPYQLGFQPRHSLVAIYTRNDVVAFIARFDLPGESVMLAQTQGVFAMTIDRATAAGADAAVLVAYDPEPHGWQVVDSARHRLQQAGLTLTLAAAVDGRNWVPLTGGDSGRATGWRELPDASSSPSVAELVGLGHGALPDREAALARLDPDEDFRSELPLLSLRQRRSPVRAGRDWRRFHDLKHGPDGAPAYDPSGASVLALGRSLLDRDFRDALIAHLAPGIIPLAEVPIQAVLRARDCGATWEDPGRDGESDRASSRAHGLLARWLILATRSPDDLAASPYAAAAIAAARVGDGMTAVAAIERALIAEPGHVLARLMRQLMAIGAFPGRSTGERTTDLFPETAYRHGVG